VVGFFLRVLSTDTVVCGVIKDLYVRKNSKVSMMKNDRWVEISIL